MNPHEALRQQYHAALQMLRVAITECPDSLWTDASYPNQFWHIAYHALFFTNFYLQPSESDFALWPKHRPDYQYLGATLPWRPNDPPKIGAPYSKQEVLECHEFCVREVDAKLPSLDLNLPSGFHWLPFDKFEAQIHSLRHLSHHTGQLIDRLRTKVGKGVPWMVRG